MMEEFLPSEIARAVYGYLLSEGCEDAANSFLETSPSLAECKQRVKHGKRLTHANTLLLGKKLAEVLNIACSVHSIVKQIHDKQQKGVSTDGHESLTELLDQLRTCVFSETRVEENNSSQPLSQPDSHCLVFSPHHLRTPPRIAGSLADNYKSLVQECSEGLDLSQSPEKTLQKNKNVDSPCMQPLNRPTSAPGALGLSQLDMDNESAIAAITGMGITANVPQVGAVSSSSPPPPASSSTSHSYASSVAASSTTATATAVSTVATTSHHPQPATSENNPIVSADGLPDPPIIVLNSQNQSFEGSDTSAAYFNVPPCAASTPQPRITFMPEDTAFILYPPLTTAPKPKKVPIKEKTNLRRSGRLRKLLPKPPRKDPPHVIHIKVLPQTIDEENEEDTDEANEIDLAEQLPNSEEKIVPEDDCERHTMKEGEIEVVKNIEVVATTSDKENISDENILKGNSVEGSSSNNLATECDKETSTPRPPPLRKNISRSTPRRNSHVRALSFNTPHKPVLSRKANTSPKMPKIKFSPRSAKLSCVKRSSLFSPKNNKELSHVSEEDDVVTNCAEEDRVEIDKERGQIILENSPLYKVPIATRSPAPKLSSAWQEVNDIKITEKPVWDEKIRNFALGDFEDPAPPPKKGPQDKKTNIDLSPDKVNKKSIKKTDDQSPISDIQHSCKRKPSKLKEVSCTPVKSSIKNNKVDGIELLDTSRKKKNALVKSSRRKKSNKNNKSSVKKTKNGQSVLNSNEESTPCVTESGVNQESQHFIEDPQINVEDENEKVIDLSENVKHQVEGNENVLNSNILLEDLVVSSNSCFPQNNDEVRTESNNVKDSSSQMSDRSKNETVLHSNITENIDKTFNTNSSSPTFLQPNILVLETPSKEFQVCDPKVFALTTPLVKTIIQERSVLEEDLLLTPSLPPTPQLNSSPRNFTKTPCKTVIESINKNQAQTSPAVVKEDESEFTQNKITELSPTIKKVDLSNLEETNHMLSNSAESEITSCKNVQNSLAVEQTKSMTEGKMVHGSIQRNSRPLSYITSTTDSSEDEHGSHANDSVSPSSKSKIIPHTETVKKRKMLNVTRNRIYSTTESSDDEINSSKIVTNNGPNKPKVSKLVSVLLENERKSLNVKSKKPKTNKKSKISIKNQIQSSPGSFSSVNSSQDSKCTKKSSRKKDEKQSVTGGKRSKGVKENSKELTEKVVKTENMRQQLQSDLLKRERKMIFGDGFPSTSDSESDLDIFEKKRSVVVKTKVGKCPQKSKMSNQIVLSTDSSTDNINTDGSITGKCVRFNTHPGTSSGSPNQNLKPLLKGNKKTSPIKSAEKIKCQVNNMVKPLTSESGEILGIIGQNLTNVQKEKNSNISVTSNLTRDDNSKQDQKGVTTIKLSENKLNGQTSSTNNCNFLDKVPNNQLEKTAADKSLKQSEILPSPESNLCFKNLIQNKCSTGSQVRPTVTDAGNLSNEAGFPEKQLKNTTDCIKIRDTENESEISMASSKSTRLENHNPGSPTDKMCAQNNSQEIKENCLEKDNNEGENEICITSTSTTKQINTTSMLNHLDQDRRDIFQIDESSIALSYSQIIKHYYYSPNPTGEFVQIKNTEGIQSDVAQNNSVADKKVTFEEPTVKRRIKLIPIEDDKYEQKLQVDYDFIDDDNVIVNRGNRRLSSEMDILDCSTSSILSSDTGYVKKQSLNFIRNPMDSLEIKQEMLLKNQGSTIDAVKKSRNKENSCVNEIKIKFQSSPQKEIKNNHSGQTQTNLQQRDDTIKNVKYGGDKEMSRETMNETRPRNQRNHDSRRQYEREVPYKGGRNHSRHEKELPSPSGRRLERDKDSRYNRSYDRRDYRRRYSERWRRESDRRGFVERRNHSSHSYFRRRSSPDSQTSRHDTKRHFKTSIAENDPQNIEKLKENLSQIEKHDLDRVDKLEKSTVGRFTNQSKVDPRAAQVLTYSDVERNESSRDEADSLMDFAVLTRKKDNRTQDNLPMGTSDSNLSILQDESKGSKRKAPANLGESSDASHVEKKLKLGEVEMKEAKSVLKHKMADMLNVLHPDTSNEAT